MPMTPGENGGGLSRKHVLAAIDASLQRLGMDYVDLYQIHRWDSRTPIEETMEALHDVVRAGKARYIGASSMFAWQFAKAQHIAERHGWTRFVSMQNHYNLIYREEEREMIPLCLDQGRRRDPLEPARPRRPRRQPHARGRAPDDPRGRRSVHRLPLHPADRLRRRRPRRRGCAPSASVPPAQVALAWLLHRPAVTAPIVGATKIEHLRDALAAEELELSGEEIERLQEPYVPHPVLGHG